MQIVLTNSYISYVIRKFFPEIISSLLVLYTPVPKAATPQQGILYIFSKIPHFRLSFADTLIHFLEQMAGLG